MHLCMFAVVYPLKKTQFFKLNNVILRNRKNILFFSYKYKDKGWIDIAVKIEKYIYVEDLFLKKVAITLTYAK